MTRKNLRFGPSFRVALGAERSQAAEKVVAPGESEGGPDNRRRGADPWLYVVAGTGSARAVKLLCAVQRQRVGNPRMVKKLERKLSSWEIWP
jgi:hypothetical protein